MTHPTAARDSQQPDPRAVKSLAREFRTVRWALETCDVAASVAIRHLPELERQGLLPGRAWASEFGGISASELRGVATAIYTRISGEPARRVADALRAEADRIDPPAPVKPSKEDLLLTAQSLDNYWPETGAYERQHRVAVYLRHIADGE